MSLANSSRNVTDDLSVEDDVRAELENLGLRRQRFLDVRVDQRVVTITGIVDSYAEKYVIERAARRVIGVRDVRDSLEVRPCDPEPHTDRLIALAARDTLNWDARVPVGVGVDVTDGALRLHGTVERFAQLEAAEEAVRNLVGVRDVVNEIRLAAVAPAADIAGAVESALRRRVSIACPHAWIIERKGVITVSGVVATLELVAEVERIVRSVPGVVRVDNRLLVA